MEEYTCKVCIFSTNKKQYYTRHINTKSHKENYWNDVFIHLSLPFEFFQDADYNHFNYLDEKLFGEYKDFFTCNIATILDQHLNKKFTNIVKFFGADNTLQNNRAFEESWHKKYHQFLLKRYRDLHKEDKRQYTIEHKEQIKARNTKKETCECGAVITHQCMKEHKRTERHFSAMQYYKTLTK